MTILLGISAFMLSIALLLLILYLLTTLKSLKEAFSSVKELVEDIKKEIRPTVQDMRESLLETRDLIADIDRKLQKTNELFEIVEDVSQNIKLPANIAASAVEASAVTAVSLLHGIKEGVKTFIKKEEK